MIHARIRILSLSLIFLSAFQASSFADTIQGRAARVSARQLDVTVYDAQGRPYPHTLALKIDRNTRVTGIRAVTDLRVNDAVGAQVSQMEAGSWHADEVAYLQGAVKPATVFALPADEKLSRQSGGAQRASGCCDRRRGFRRLKRKSG